MYNILYMYLKRTRRGQKEREIVYRKEYKQKKILYQMGDDTLTVY